MDGTERSSAFADIVERLNPAHIWVCAGFGFAASWIWLGLLLGYPAFRDGVVDAASVVCVLAGFAGILFGLAFADAVRTVLMRWHAVLVVSLLACVASGLCVAYVGGMLRVDGVAGMMLVRVSSCVMGMGTGVLFACFARFFCRLEPKMALFAYCMVVAASFFAFFLAVSLEDAFSGFAFSLFPAVAAASLRLDMAENAGADHDAEARPGQSPRGYRRMALSFAVFVFAASLTQSFEPLSDFGLSVDEGFVFFGACMAVVFFLVYAQRKVGTFAVLKVFYQASVILLVMKLVLQPLASSDTYFAAFNVITWLMLFTVVWLLSSFVAGSGEMPPLRTFAIVFGTGALCMAVAWLVGKHIYAQFGHDRLYFSIAAGCIVSVFCTFGFSIRDFPYLLKSGKGIERMLSNDGDGEVQGVAREVPVGEVLASLASEFHLSERECEVLGLMMDGLGPQEVADQLVISYYTVRTHIRNIYTKLDVNSRSDLFLAFMQRKSHLSVRPAPADDGDVRQGICDGGTGGCEAGEEDLPGCDVASQKDAPQGHP